VRDLHPIACLLHSPAHRSNIELLLRVAVLKRSCTLTALLFCAGTIAAGSSVNALKFTSIDFPGARTTEATGINRHGQIVGTWEDPQTRLGHGFLLSGGVYRTFDVPGARATYPRDINDEGLIVGTYDLPPQDGQICCETHGFVRTPEGQFITVTFPGVPGLPVTWLAGVNNLGEIVGGYSEFDETILDTRGIHGFLLDDGVFTAIDFPTPTPRVNIPVTYANDVNDAGDVVGGYNEDDVFQTRRGYVLSRGEFSNFDVPGSSSTEPFAINNAGEIIGEYQDVDGFRSFLFSPQKGLRTLALSGKEKRQISFLLPMGINDSSQIVGSYNDTPTGANLNDRLSLSSRWLFGPEGAHGQNKTTAERLANQPLDGSLHGFFADPPPKR
jgi:hypothetical protein